MADSGKEKALLISPIFQLILIGITTLSIIGILYISISRFNPLDKIPQVKTLTPEKILEFGNPAPTKVGMYIKDYPVVDFVGGNFAINAMVWFVFDPSAVSLETIGRFVFENGEIKNRSLAEVKIVDEGYLFARYNVRVDFKLPLQYNLFPVDDHRLFFVLVNDFTSPGQIMLESVKKDFVVDSDLEMFGWHNRGAGVRAGYTESILNPNDPNRKVYAPRAVFYVDYSHIGIRYVLSIFLPLILIFFISLFGLSFNIEGRYAGSAFGLVAGGITGMITYYFVIQNMSPEVGYFMISDYIYFLFLSLNFLVFIITIFGAEIQTWVKKAFMLTCHGLILAVTFYLFLMWMN
jgi:hypothetical protein